MTDDNEPDKFSYIAPRRRPTASAAERRAAYEARCARRAAAAAIAPVVFAPARLSLCFALLSPTSFFSKSKSFVHSMLFHFMLFHFMFFHFMFFHSMFLHSIIGD